MATQITKVNYWTEGDSEYYAAWADDAHDHNGDVPTGVDAAEWLAERFPAASIEEVDGNP